MEDKNSKLEQVQKMLSDMISSSKSEAKTFHYEKETPKRYYYAELNDRELLSLLDEKKEQLRIMVETLETKGENVIATWLNLLAVFIGLISAVSAIVIPLAKGLTTGFYAYLISLGIIMIFVFCYLLIDRRSEFKNKLYNIRLKRTKLTESRALIRHVEDVIKSFTSTEMQAS